LTLGIAKYVEWCGETGWLSGDRPTAPATASAATSVKPESTEPRPARAVAAR
jgi:hypothetical protein